MIIVIFSISNRHFKDSLKVAILLIPDLNVIMNDTIISEEILLKEFEVKINAEIKIEPKDWMPVAYRSHLIRQISQHALLYTEMVTTGAIIFGKGDYLAFNQEEHHGYHDQC